MSLLNHRFLNPAESQQLTVEPMARTSVRPLGDRGQARLHIAAALSLMLLTGCAGPLGGGGDDLMHVSCLEAPARGRCSSPIDAVYYDYQSDTCRVFRPGVCDRDWPFRTMRDCVAACGGRPQR
ncbi:BPTI/Kunitz domain-containing protein [Halochromatium glycolicum]|uniref:BPTI/Kunitz inhibitor domain-containing protein n=1 Tax=Halochromatium glycolicum TaxID=85075 RepID=A0AAJ0XAU2_9GAMM|nr:BPTI/Kunitz domain-containing protein [Halochromatium glycolicum]MBK1705708.1 hypothetical protein [Halochromatium glycolicum]